MRYRPPALIIGAVSLASAASAGDMRCATDVALVHLERGVIANEDIAKAVAWTYLAPIYGKETISREMPLRASLSGGIWTVDGTLSPGSVGGTAQILLCQSNGTVLSLMHSK